MISVRQYRFISLVLFFILFCQFNFLPELKKHSCALFASAILNESADFVIDSFEFAKTDKDKKKWILKSEKAEVFGNEAKLHRGKIDFFADTPEKKYSIFFKKGHLNRETGVVTLEKDIVLIFNNKNKEDKLKTEYINFDGNAIIENDTQNIIYFSDNIIKCSGIYINLDRETFKLKNNVDIYNKKMNSRVTSLDMLYEINKKEFNITEKVKIYFGDYKLDCSQLILKLSEKNTIVKGYIPEDYYGVNKKTGINVNGTSLLWFPEENIIKTDKKVYIENDRKNYMKAAGFENNYEKKSIKFKGHPEILLKEQSLKAESDSVYVDYSGKLYKINMVSDAGINTADIDFKGENLTIFFKPVKNEILRAVTKKKSSIKYVKGYNLQTNEFSLDFKDNNISKGIFSNHLSFNYPGYEVSSDTLHLEDAGEKSYSLRFNENVSVTDRMKFNLFSDKLNILVENNNISGAVFTDNINGVINF